MAMDNNIEEFEKIEELKTTVRTSFARIYANLKARELKTLRQLDAIHKQSRDDKNLNRNCAQSIRIYFENESDLLENISKYGAIDFERIHFNSSAFLLEDYVNPEDDHMYLYKDINNTVENLAIEEAALKQLTSAENCVCYVNIRSEDVSKKFRDTVAIESQVHPENSTESVYEDTIESIETETNGTRKDSSDVDVKKIDPTEDWLNEIKNQTETEPQNVDVMEHSSITVL